MKARVGIALAVLVGSILFVWYANVSEEAAPEPTALPQPATPSPLPSRTPIPATATATRIIHNYLPTWPTGTSVADVLRQTPRAPLKTHVWPVGPVLLVSDAGNLDGGDVYTPVEPPYIVVYTDGRIVRSYFTQTSDSIQLLSMQTVQLDHTGLCGFLNTVDSYGRQSLRQLADVLAGWQPYDPEYIAVWVVDRQVGGHADLAWPVSEPKLANMYQQAAAKDLLLTASDMAMLNGDSATALQRLLGNPFRYLDAWFSDSKDAYKIVVRPLLPYETLLPKVSAVPGSLYIESGAPIPATPVVCTPEDGVLLGLQSR